MNLNEIASEIYSSQTKVHQDMVNSFELYRDYIENADVALNPELYTLKTRLLADYAIALTYVKDYKKSVLYLNIALPLLLNDIKIDKKNIKEIEFYELLIFNRAVSNYNLGKLSIAKTDFDLLVKLYPEKIIYKNWQESLNLMNLNKVKNILWIIGAFFLLIEILFEYIHLPSEIPMLFTVLFMSIAIIIEIIVFFKKKEIQNKTYST